VRNVGSRVRDPSCPNATGTDVIFFDANERWLTTVLEGGLRAGVFRFSDSANERARVLLGAFEE
jgi:hypothetical protein